MALGQGGRCLLAARNRQGPVVAPMAYWFDGTSAWLSAPVSSASVAALEHDPVCALWVGPDASTASCPGSPAPAGGRGALARGVARVFSVRDPLGLALHSPVLVGAMAALATANVRNARRIRSLPGKRVILRVTVTHVEDVVPPALPPGIAPALPTIIPPEVRRALAGQRQVVLATAEDDRLRVQPAAWGAGFSLAVPDDIRLPSGAAAVAALDAEVLGLSLAGTIAPGPALRPDRVTWWHGSAVDSADVPPPAAAVTLPD